MLAVGFMITDDFDLALTSVCVIFVVAFIGVIWYILHICFKTAREEREELNVSSEEEARQKALVIVEKLRWAVCGSLQVKNKRYVAMRYAQEYVEDYDWLVKYISYAGECVNKDEIAYPYAIKRVLLDDAFYSCQRINEDYTTLEIYKTYKSK